MAAVSDPGQKKYDKTYVHYFDDYCNLLQDEIFEHERFLKFNQTRNE